MINTIQQRTVTNTGIDIMSVVDGEVFAYGRVTLMKKKDCIVVLSSGPNAGKKVRMPLSYPCTVEGVHYVADIPEPVVVEKKAGRGKPAAGEKTKIQICRELFAAHPELDKAAMVGLFVSEAKCTPAGSNTYFLTLKKEFATKG